MVKTYNICNNTLTVENNLAGVLIICSLSDKSNLSVYCHTALIRYPDNRLNCQKICAVHGVTYVN